MRPDPALEPGDARRFERVVEDGGIVVFPTDTVYGLGCDPTRADAVARLYALKERAPDKAAAVMWFSVEGLLADLPELDEPTRGLVRALLPGAVTLLLPNPSARFALACGPDVRTLGVRVPALPPRTAALSTVRVPVMQSSANLSGGSDPRRMNQVPASIRANSDLKLEGATLPGTPSTVVDARRFAASGELTVRRHGAVPDAAVHAAGATVTR
jgi:L-threonylcarbamoyladenylate synthase